MSSGHVISMVISVHIPFVHSLKEKRRYIKSLKDKIRKQFNVSIAEIDGLNEWQKSVLGVVMISNERIYLEKQVAAIETLILQVHDIQITDISTEWL
ncbi:MAG TPA: DUF503 domain-containing protein [Gammaproteobacteria bacterium]